MAGLGLGNALAAAFGRRVANPVRAYAYAEAAIALTGVGLVYLFPVVGVVLAPLFRPLLDQPWLLNPLRLLVAFVLLLVPSTAMGITLPLLITALADRSGIPSRHGPKDEGGFGRVLGWLYGWNTLGAVIGVLAGETFFLGRFGVRGTALAAGGLNLAAAVVAGLVSVRGPGPATRLESVRRGPGGQIPSSPLHLSSASRLARPLIAVFLSGFCLLALEVIWFRFLLLFVKGHSVAFAVMLAVVLAGIAAGGLAAALWLRLMPGAYRFAAPLAFVAAVAVVASYRYFPSVIEPFGLESITQPEAIVRVSLPLMFPVAFISGMFFPVVGAALRGGLTSEIATAGTLTLANTIGAAVGSLVAGFVLLPLLGIERSFFTITLLYAAVGMVVGRLWRAPFIVWRRGRCRHRSRGFSIRAVQRAPCVDSRRTMGAGRGRAPARRGARRVD